MSGLLRDTFRPINTAAIIIMGVYTMLFGLWVLSPFWDTLETAKMFRIMNAWAPEYVWGLLAFVVGATICYGVVRSSYKSLTQGAMVGFLFWIVISILLFLGDWKNTGGLTFLMIAVYCGFIRLNLWINRKNYI